MIGLTLFNDGRIRRPFFLLFTSIIISFCFSCGKDEELIDGVEMLVPNKVYVVHSMIYAKQRPWTTSNIYLIKGTGDTVWIYGSGYGDFNLPCGDECNDNNYYLGEEFHGTGPATEDVKLVDSIIQNEFSLIRENVILQFIVPHYHNDHINSEFIDAFYSAFNYKMKSGEHIWIHVNDSIGALCDEPCCGTEPCPDKKNKYYGVPFRPGWKPEYKAMFIVMGNENDECNKVIKSFTSSIGEWTITKAVAVKDKGHTDGTINLNNESMRLRITGTKSKIQCELPEGWNFITVHDNLKYE